MNSKNDKTAISNEHNAPKGVCMVVMIPFPRYNYRQGKEKITLKQIEKVRLMMIAKSRHTIEEEIDKFIDDIKPDEDIDEKIDNLSLRSGWNCDSVFMTKEDYEKLVKDSPKKEILWGLE